MRKSAILFLIFIVVLAIAAAIENKQDSLQDIEALKSPEISLNE